jgi:hypothetical protein
VGFVQFRAVRIPEVKLHSPGGKALLSHGADAGQAASLIQNLIMVAQWKQATCIWVSRGSKRQYT